MILKKLIVSLSQTRWIKVTCWIIHCWIVDLEIGSSPPTDFWGWRVIKVKGQKLFRRCTKRLNRNLNRKQALNPVCVSVGINSDPEMKATLTITLISLQSNYFLSVSFEKSLTKSLFSLLYTRINHVRLLITKLTSACSLTVRNHHKLQDGSS